MKYPFVPGGADSLQRFLDVTDVIIILIGSDQTVRLINRRGAEILGLPVEEIVGRNWFDHFLPARLREEVRRVFLRLIESGETPSDYYENPVLTAQGEERVIGWHNTVLTDGRSRSVATLSSGQDVTENRRAHRHLQAQYGVIRHLVESPDFEKALPPLLEIIATAEQWEVGELWKRDPESGVLRREACWCLPGAGVEGFLEESVEWSFRPGEGLVGRVLQSGEPEMVTDLGREPEFLRRDLALQNGLHSGFAFPVRDRVPFTRLMVFLSREFRPRDPATLELLKSLERQIREFAERRRSEKALRRSEARLQAILDTIVDGVVTIDERGIIESFNPAAERIFGYRAEDAIGRNVSILMPEPDRSNHDLYLSRYLQTGEARIIGVGREVIGRRKDGSTFPMYLSIGEMQYGMGRRFTGLIRDFSDYRRLQEEMLKARNLASIGEMTASVAHEIRNPIAGISGALQVTWEQMGEGDRHREILREVLDQARRLDETVRHLLLFAKPWSAQTENHPAGKVLGRIVETLKEEREYRNIRFRVEGSRTAQLHIDLSLADHLFGNLFQNAADAMPEGGTVRLQIERLQTGTAVSVIDSGEGISPETTAKAFRPFFTTKPRGTGLGLSICRKIMEAHGGSISISRGASGGTVVRLDFPRGD